MKKLLNILTLGAIIGLSACDKDAFKDNVALGESINEFELESPANFSSLLLNASQNDKVIDVKWNEAVTGLGTPPTYRFLLDEKGGDFSTPLLSMESNNSGADNALSLTYEELIDAIDGATSEEYIWTVEAQVVVEKGITKLDARASFEIDLTVSSEGISEFSYLAPAVNEKLAFDKFATPNDVIEFSWESTTSLSGDPVSYTIQFDNPGNDFSNPLFESVSDNSGVDAMFSITHTDLTNLLDTILYVDGLNWRIVAKVGEVEYSPGAQYVRFDPAKLLVLYIVGDGVPSAGWNWDSPIEMTSIEDGVVEATTDFLNSEAFRFFTLSGDWGSGLNFPYYIDEGYTIDSRFEDALDGDNNFRFTGATGAYTITVNDNDKTIKLVEVPAYPSKYLVGSGVPDAGWGWGTPIELVQIEPGVYEAANVTFAVGAFRVFATDGDWGSGTNYPTYISDGYAISSNFEDAMDGDNNFQFNGTPGTFKFTLNENTKTIVATVGLSKYLVGSGVPDAGWGWSSPIELAQIEAGVYEATTEFANGAFRVFATKDDWGSGTNYPTYISNGYTIDADFGDAMDGDNNFQFNGTPGDYRFVLDENSQTITLF